MKEQFTKGEWILEGGSVWCNGRPVCAMGDSWVTYDDDKANAHLIAAAPEMYKFLDNLANGRGTDYPIEKLLAKARGEQ